MSYKKFLIVTLKELNSYYLTIAKDCFKIATNKNLNDEEKQNRIDALTYRLEYTANQDIYAVNEFGLSTHAVNEFGLSTLKKKQKEAEPQGLMDIKIQTRTAAFKACIDSIQALKADAHNIYARLCKNASSPKDAFSDDSLSCIAMAEYLEGLNEDATDFTAPGESKNVSLARMLTDYALERIKENHS